MTFSLRVGVVYGTLRLFPWKGQGFGGDYKRISGSEKVDENHLGRSGTCLGSQVTRGETGSRRRYLRQVPGTGPEPLGFSDGQRDG